MHIERIYVFPVKSLKGIQVKESPIDDYGFKHDRMYALASPGKNGTYTVLTQRQEPSLARIETAIIDSSLVMSYTKDGKYREAKLPMELADLPQDMPTLNMELWGLDMVCSDVGALKPELKQFFGDFFAESPKYKDTTVIVSKTRRPVPTAGPETDAFVKESGRAFNSSFQDLFPGTIMTTASFEELSEYVDVKSGVAIDERSFRMNMVVSTDEPWIEDDWKRLKIGEHEWFVDRLCERCSMPAVDQDLGTVRELKQPLPELNRFRIMEKGKTPCFGICVFNKDVEYLVRVNDKVEVLESHE